MFDMEDIETVVGVGEPFMTTQAHRQWVHEEGYTVTLKNGKTLHVPHDDFAAGYQAVMEYYLEQHKAVSRAAATASVSAFETAMAQAAELGNVTTQDGYIPAATSGVEF